jgi:hypothetical protein
MRKSQPRSQASGAGKRKQSSAVVSDIPVVSIRQAEEEEILENDLFLTGKSSHYEIPCGATFFVWCDIV